MPFIACDIASAPLELVALYFGVAKLAAPSIVVVSGDGGEPMVAMKRVDGHSD